MARLDGAVSLVTGASRGAGRGIALELGAAGATVGTLAREYGFTDVDGMQPPPFRVDASDREPKRRT